MTLWRAHGTVSNDRARVALGLGQVIDYRFGRLRLRGSRRTKESQAENAHMREVEQPLAGGKLLAAISTRIVAILRERYGRGPMRAKTYALDDIIVVGDAR